MCSRTLRKITHLTQNTRSLRRCFTQNLRNNYANKITHILRKYLHFTQIDYADITQILRRYYANKLRIYYAFYAKLRK